MNKTDFSQLLLKTRQEKEISQRELSRRTGFTTRAIQYWETEQRQISLENADKLLKALGVEIKIGGTKWKH